jgi:hypothetical protein
VNGNKRKYSSKAIFVLHAWNIRNEMIKRISSISLRLCNLAFVFELMSAYQSLGARLKHTAKKYARGPNVATASSVVEGQRSDEV